MNLGRLLSRCSLADIQPRCFNSRAAAQPRSLLPRFQREKHAKGRGYSRGSGRDWRRGSRGGSRGPPGGRSQRRSGPIKDLKARSVFIIEVIHRREGDRRPAGARSYFSISVSLPTPITKTVRSGRFFVLELFLFRHRPDRIGTPNTDNEPHSLLQS